jgi:pimeloyl-ACP methyl ester carboxylesterase
MTPRGRAPGSPLPDRRRRRTLAAAVTVALLSCGACGPTAAPSGGGPAGASAPDSVSSSASAPDGTPESGPVTLFLTVGDQQAVVRSPAHPNGRLVLFLHGASGSAEDVLRIGDGLRADLVAGLVAAGYVVAAGDAHGAAWGNAASVADYEALVSEARRRTGATSVYLLAESMGGLAAAQLTTPGRVDGLRAYAGIYPVCDLSSVRGIFAASIDAAHGADSDAAVAALSPVRPDPAVPLMIWASAADTVVPREQNADVCVAEVHAGGGQAVLNSTVGEHGDPSNFVLPQVLAFFDAAS